MIFGLLAIIAAAFFTGAAVYINWAEQPARLGLDDRAMLQHWKPSYARGFIMQASLAVVGFVLGVFEWLVSGDWTWLVGAVVLVANWPYTMFVVMPTNRLLDATAPEQAGPKSRALIARWGYLHSVRSMLGALATAIFLWASL